MARVLLLEDDLDQLELRRLLLEAAGHRVETAASVGEAMERTHGVDVVVLDLVPGFEDLLAGVPGSVRVVVLTGRDTVSSAVSARSACVLRKPCSSRVLMEAIGHHG